MSEFIENTLSMEELRRGMPFGVLNPRFWKYASIAAWRDWSLPRHRKCPGSAAVLNSDCSHNYYHWLIDIVPRLWALLTYYGRPDWFVVDKCMRFQQETLKAFGIPLDRVIQPHATLHLEADELIVPSDMFQGAFRESSAAMATALAPVSSKATPPRIFINRRNSRHVRNQAEFTALLAKHGFQEFFLEDLPFSEQITLFRGAEIVLALHGAGLSNVAYCRPGTRVIEIVPERLRRNCFPMLSRIMELRHTLISAPRTQWIGQTVNVPLDVLEDRLTTPT